MITLKKLIFYGLGGAGQRHLRYLYKYYQHKTIFFAYRKKNKVQHISKNFQLTGKLLNQKYKKIKFFRFYKDSLIAKIDYAFICGPTLNNFQIVTDCLKIGRNIFVEKPFVCSWKNYLLFKARINKLYSGKILVGYQKRFHPLVLKLKKILEKNNNKNIKTRKKVFIEVNSYVPNWHKYENFKNLYACKKKLGGGALFTESHEIDLCIYFFGIPKKVYCKKYFLKEMKIDVETSYILILFYENDIVYFNVNMFSQNLKRVIKIIDKNCKYELDLEKNTLVINTKKKSYLYNSSDSVVDMQFMKQLKYFFSKSFSLKKSLTQIENNLRVFHACERSFKQKKIVNI